MRQGVLWHRSVLVGCNKAWEGFGTWGSVEMMWIALKVRDTRKEKKETDGRERILYAWGNASYEKTALLGHA